MSIDGVSGRTSYIGTSILNIRRQLDDLTQQLASGRVSTTYAGQGANRGFALSLRAQVSGLDAYRGHGRRTSMSGSTSSTLRCRDCPTLALR